MKLTTKYQPLISLPVGEKQAKEAVSYHEMKESFEPFLIEEILTGLYDTEVPFTQAEDLKACRYCPFALSCGR